MSKPNNSKIFPPPWLKNRKTLGNWGEKKATATLQQKGFTLKQSNWHCRHGEIDLIMVDGTELVFVEVKTRRTDAAGLPEEAITPQKAAQLVRLARLYLANENREWDWRIDFVAVECDAGGYLQRCEHFKCAVWGW